VVVNQVAGIGLILLGMLVCFLGYRLLRVVLGIVGFLAGAVGATWLGGDVLHISRVWLLIAGLVGGIVGAVLAAVLFKVGVFILGAAGGALAALALLSAPRPLVLVAVAVAGGILTLLLQKPLVSIATAFIGAWGVVAGAFHLAGWYELPDGLGRLGNFAGLGQRGLMMLGAWVVLGIIGTIVQLSARKRKKQE